MRTDLRYRRKRLMITLAATSMVLAGTAACGSSGTTNGGSTGSADGARIGYSATFLTDPYQVVLQQYLKNNARDLKLKLLPPTDAGNDAGKQITDISTLVNQGIKGLVTIAQNSSAIKPALDIADRNKVPVVVIDQPPSKGHVYMIVRADNAAMGAAACESMGKQLNGKGKVLEIQGDLSGLDAQERTTGFNNCMKQNFPGITVVAKPANWVQDTATTVAQTVLSTDSGVTGVYLESDSAYAPGVVHVLQNLGKWKPTGSPGHIAIASIDGTSFALHQVRTKYFDVVISQPTDLYAKYSLYYLKAGIGGKKFSPGKTDHGTEISRFGENLQDIVPATTVTSKNVDDKSLWGNVSTQAS